jgi:hypothetical protein
MSVLTIALRRPAAPGEKGRDLTRRGAYRGTTMLVSKSVWGVRTAHLLSESCGIHAH